MERGWLYLLAGVPTPTPSQPLTHVGLLCPPLPRNPLASYSQPPGHLCQKVLPSMLEELIFLTALSHSPFPRFHNSVYADAVGSCTQLIPFLHSCVSHTPMPLHSLVPERHLTNEFVPCPGGWGELLGGVEKMRARRKPVLHSG